MNSRHLAGVLICSVRGHLSDETWDKTNTKCGKASGPSWVNERLPAEWEMRCSGSALQKEEFGIAYRY